MTEPELAVDVLVVGSGNGAIDRRVVRVRARVNDVLVVEKTSCTAVRAPLSGGGIWIPCNRYAREAGAEDSLDAAREYLRATIPEGCVPDAMIETYVRQGPRMLDFLHERTRVRYESLAHYPDYWSFLPGRAGRAPLARTRAAQQRRARRERPTLRALHHMMWLADRIPIKQVEAQALMAQLPGWRSLAGNLLWEYVSDFGWWLQAQTLAPAHEWQRRRRAPALVDARPGMPLWLDTRL